MTLSAFAGEVRLAVHDDGVGIATGRQARGIGLTGIGERVRALGGSVTIRSHHGTELLVSIPLPGIAAARAA